MLQQRCKTTLTERCGQTFIQLKYNVAATSSGVYTATLSQRCGTTLFQRSQQRCSNVSTTFVCLLGNDPIKSDTEVSQLMEPHLGRTHKQNNKTIKRDRTQKQGL